MSNGGVQVASYLKLICLWYFSHLSYPAVAMYPAI